MANTGGRSLASRAGSVARRVVGRRTAKQGSASEVVPAKKTPPKKAPATKVVAKKAPAKKALATKTVAKKAPAKKAPAKKAPATKTVAKKAPAKRATATKTPAKKTPAKKTPTNKQVSSTSAKKVPVKKTVAAPAVAAKQEAGPRKGAGRARGTSALVVREGEKSWTKDELNEVRAHLRADIKRLVSELEVAEEDLHGLMLDAGDGAGNDQADVGSSTFERDQEIVIANNARDMLEQSEHALERIADGSYGVCESNGEPIGKMRLMAFPRATLCLSCKQREERH